MAEVLGAVASGLTVAALFKGCIEAFNLIQTVQNQDADLQKLTLRFNIEKGRLYVWGEAMGLTAPPAPGQTRALESSPFQSLVRDTLEAILSAFRDTQRMKQQYGCKEAPAVNNRKRRRLQQSLSDPVKNLAATFSNFRIVEGARDTLGNLALQTRWVIHDRKKFSELVSEAKTLIDGLQEITKALSTVARQEGMMRYGIQQIKDVDTLQLVADVSQKDYPDMSDAASIKVDILTIATHQRLGIEAWADNVGGGLDDETADVESMTITELKHRLWFAVHDSRRSDTLTEFEEEKKKNKQLIENAAALQEKLDFLHSLNQIEEENRAAAVEILTELESRGVRLVSGLGVMASSRLPGEKRI